MDGFKNTTKTQYSTTAGRRFARGGMTVSRNDMAGGEGPMSKPAMVAKYAKGGSVSSRADGVATKGKTKGKMLATGGLLSPGPKGTMVKHTNKKPQGVGATFANPRGMDTLPPRPAPAVAAAPKPQNMGGNTTLRRNEGGVVKKAAGGLTLGNKTMYLPSTGSQIPQPVKLPSNLAGQSKGLTLGNKTMVDTGAGMRASTGPVTLGNNRMVDTGKGMRASTGPITLGNAPMIKLGKKNGGVVKKAAGGLTLGNKTVSLPSTGLKLGNAPMINLPSKGLTLGNKTMVDTGNGMRASSGPITLGNRTMAAPGIKLGNAPMIKLGKRNGGLAVMPKGKGCK